MYNYLLTFLSFTIGNYIWQIAFERDWEKAFERTYFQLIALLIFAMIQKFVG